jgi:hypothetical protein
MSSTDRKRTRMTNHAILVTECLKIRSKETGRKMEEEIIYALYVSSITPKSKYNSEKQICDCVHDLKIYVKRIVESSQQL